MDTNKAQEVISSYFASQVKDIKDTFSDTNFSEICLRIYLTNNPNSPLVALARAYSFEFLDFDFIESGRMGSIQDSLSHLKKKLSDIDNSYKEARAKKLLKLHKEAAALGCVVVEKGGL